MRGVLAGLWHAHTGWLLSTQGRADWKRYAPDLYEDPGMRLISRSFVPLVLLGLALPGARRLPASAARSPAPLTGLLWGGLVRVFFVHHVTWSVNSVCHFLGTRRFETDDHSTNVFWLALPSLGESWHHNHHAFPRSADPRPAAVASSTPPRLIIATMERLGLAWNVIRISAGAPVSEGSSSRTVRVNCDCVRLPGTWQSHESPHTAFGGECRERKETKNAQHQQSAR